MGQRLDIDGPGGPLCGRPKAINAFAGLEASLAHLARLIKIPDDDPLIRAAAHEKRKRFLLTYRDWIVRNAPFSEDIFGDSPYLERLFPYLHNEFHFNSARKIGRIARLSHVVFAPLFVERTAGESDDELKKLADGTKQTLKWLLEHAVHDHRRERDFRGGKDYFFTFITELFDYSEPIITPKRLVIDVKNETVAASPCPHAKRETEKLDAYISSSGVSNRSTNVVEFFYQASQLQKIYCRWVRHDRPYQTFTVTQESTVTVDADSSKQQLILGANEPWFKYFSNPGSIGAQDPFETTALHALKHDIFRPVVGRYVQGANYLVLPLKMFLRRPLEEVSEGTFAAALDKLLPEQRNFFSRRAAWLDRPCVYEGLRDVEFQQLLQRIRNSEIKEKIAELDRLVASVTRDFLRLCFREGNRAETDYLAFKCWEGRAYVFSNVGNNGHRQCQHDCDELFSRTIVIDCGMNGYERGRLVQNLMEFEGERILSLLNLPRFRLVHQALNVVQSRLALANSNYSDNRPQTMDVIPQHYRDARNLTGDILAGERGLIVALEWLSACLTVLNDVVEGGISGRASITVTAINVVHQKLDSIGHETLLGHQSLRDFIERRFSRSARAMERTGEHFRMLRQRITENAELVDAKLQVIQRDKQALLLQAAEVFVAVGGAYYLSQLAIHGLPQDFQIHLGIWISRLPFVTRILWAADLLNRGEIFLYLISVSFAFGLVILFHLSRLRIDPPVRSQRRFRGWAALIGTRIAGRQ